MNRYRLSFLLVFVLGLAAFAACSGKNDPLKEVFENCDFSVECVPEADLCQRIEVNTPQGLVFGGVCTVECTASDQCPDLGICADFSNGQGLTTCQRACVSNADCPQQGFYQCLRVDTVDYGPTNLCVPVCPDGDTTAGC